MRLATAAVTTVVLLAGTTQAAQPSVNDTAGAVVWAPLQPSVALKSNDPRRTQSGPSRLENSFRDGLSSPTPVSGDNAVVDRIDDSSCGLTRDGKQCDQRQEDGPAPTAAPDVADAAGAKHLANPGKFVTFMMTHLEDGKEKKFPIEMMYPDEVVDFSLPVPTGKEIFEKSTEKNNDKTNKSSNEKEKKKQNKNKNKKKDEKSDTKKNNKSDQKSPAAPPKPLKELVEGFAKFWEKLWGLKRKTNRKKTGGSQALFVTSDMVAEDDDLAALVETVAGALGVEGPNIPEKSSAQESKGRGKIEDEDAKVGSAFRWFDDLPATQNKKKAPSEPKLSSKDRAIFQNSQHRCDFRASHATPTETDEECLANLKAKLADNRRAVENGTLVEVDMDKDLPSTDKGCDGIVAYQQRISKGSSGGEDGSPAITNSRVERRNVRPVHHNGSLARSRGRPDALAARRAAARFQANHVHNRDKLAVQPRDVGSADESGLREGSLDQPEEEEEEQPHLSRRWGKKPKFRFGGNEDNYQEQRGPYGCEDGQCQDTVAVRDNEEERAGRLLRKMNKQPPGKVFDDDDDYKPRSPSSGRAYTAKSTLGLLIAVTLALLL